jgi:hypothetical protein
MMYSASRSLKRKFCLEMSDGAFSKGMYDEKLDKVGRNALFSWRQPSKSAPFLFRNRLVSASLAIRMILNYFLLSSFVDLDLSLY